MSNWLFGSSNILIDEKGRVDTSLIYFSTSKFIILYLRSYRDTFDLKLMNGASWSLIVGHGKTTWFDIACDLFLHFGQFS